MIRPIILIVYSHIAPVLKPTGQLNDELFGYHIWWKKRLAYEFIVKIFKIESTVDTKYEHMQNETEIKSIWYICEYAG